MTVGRERLTAPDRMKLHIGQWTVEPALNRLASLATTVKVEPKAMAVLLHLADRPGDVVSREALLAAVWPGVVVGDDSLTQVIIKLRKALGDTPDQPTYIETIPKGGYRLVAEVTRSESIAPIPADAHPDRLWVHRQRRILRRAGAGIAAMLVVAGGVWWWSDGGRVTGVPADPVPNATTDAGDRSAHPTVAIRPFDALGDDPQAVLLAQGLTADLLTDLSKVSGLSVMVWAPSSVKAGAQMPTGVSPFAYLVSGSVQRVQQRLRLQVNLVDAGTGKVLWSERFDRALTDFFAIQEELGPRILGILPAKVSEAELLRVARRDTRNLEAYEYFQRGQSALLVRQRVDNQRAREMFRHAIALDAAFARAYAGLALTNAADFRNQWTEDGTAALDRAFELASTAHQINPDIAETLWVLAFVHMERRQHEEALKYLQAALALYPSYADGYALMGGVYTYIGRPADTLPLLRTAMRLDPQAGYLYYLLLGRAYLFLGDIEQARVNLQQALARNPGNLEAHVYMAALQVGAGDKAAAAWEAEEIRALQPDFSIGRWLQTYPMTESAQQSKLMQALGALAF